MSSTPSVRVAVRPDFDPLDVQTDGPTRTKDGRPWVRWAKQGLYSGWFAAGARKPRLSGQPSFWEAVFSVACACAGGNVDQVHSCGPGMLALGGLGVTVRSGYAQLLLHRCLLLNPARYIEVMAPVLHETGVYTRATPKSPSGIGFFHSDGQRMLIEAPDGLRWERSKETERLWVSCCSELLRDETMDRAQQSFAEDVMPALLTEETKLAIRWPAQAPTDWWQYTREQQMLWALALVLALQDEKQTEELVCAARARAQDEEALMAPPATSVLLRMLGTVHGSLYEYAFQTRCAIASSLLRKLLRVEL